MANPSKKPSLGKGHEPMEPLPDLLEATLRMDLEDIKYCVQLAPASIRQTDRDGNNAMHLCVSGSASIRAPQLMKFFLEETEIDLLQENRFGYDPYDLAISVRDRAACAMIDPHWHDQLNKRHPLEEDRNFSVVKTKKKSDGPKDPSPL